MALESPRKRRRGELRALVDKHTAEDEPQQLKTLISRFGTEVLGRNLRQFQVDNAAYLLDKGGGDEKALAMVYPPGAGKSLTYVVAGCVAHGVTVIIQPTLVLSADQLEKLKQLRDTARVTAYNLDDYKTADMWERVDKRIRAATIGVPKSVVPRISLVVSPQTASDRKKPWKRLFEDLAKGGVLRLVVLDELHLVREQGETLRPEFKAMGEKVVAKVRKICPKTRLVLFTATCDISDLEMVERMCKAKITRIGWADPDAFVKRGVKISLSCRSQYSHIIKRFAPGIAKDTTKRAMFYTDFEADVSKIAKSVRDNAAAVVDSSGNVIADCLEITGTHAPEQKGFSINVFCENVSGDKEEKASKIFRFLAATSGAAATGVDPPNVELVARRGCPPSLSTMFQEEGRLLRSSRIPGWSYMYHITVDTNSYSRLIWRTETSENATREEKDRNLADHLEALRLIVLDDKCMKKALAEKFGRPGANNAIPDSCGQWCPRCSGERRKESAAFYVRPLKQCIFRIFSGSGLVKLGSSQDKSDFTTKLKDISVDAGVWVDSRKPGAARTGIEPHRVDMLVLQLLAAGIIHPRIESKKDTKGETTTTVYVQGTMNNEKTGYLFSDDDAYETITNVTKDVRRS